MIYLIYFSDHLQINAWLIVFEMFLMFLQSLTILGRLFQIFGTKLLHRLLTNIRCTTNWNNVGITFYSCVVTLI